MDKETLKIVLLSIGGTVVVFMVPVLLVLYGYRKYKEAGLRALARIVQEADAAAAGPPAQAPLVSFEFYTYQGFLNTTIQTRHAYQMPYEAARETINKLHRYNLKWGLWGLGGAFIPFISMWNRWRQLRGIRGQLESQTGRKAFP